MEFDSYSSRTGLWKPIKKDSEKVPQTQKMPLVFVSESNDSQRKLCVFEILLNCFVMLVRSLKCVPLHLHLHLPGKARPLKEAYELCAWSAVSVKVFNGH